MSHILPEVALDDPQSYSDACNRSFLLDGLADPVLGLAPDCETITYANRAAMALFEWSAETAMTLSSINFESGGSVLKSDLARTGATRRDTHVSFAGQVYCAEHQRSYAGNQILMVMRNRAASSASLSDGFVATVSHELRTPLTSVKGALGLALSGVSGPLNDKTRSLLDIAHRNVGRLMLLVNDILDLEKMSSGNMTFDMQTTDLRAVIDAACEANATFADGFDVKIACDMPDDPVLSVVDADRMHQVMTNLISNACKFSHKGGTVSLSVTPQSDGSQLIIVADQGIGISADAIETVFDRFTQAGSMHRNRSGSTGLGLAIVKTIVEAHGGTIRMASEPNCGTQVSITLTGKPPKPNHNRPAQ